MDQAGSVIKIQPAELTLARPAFQPTVISSPANVFHQEVRASNFSAERFSWNWRSPSANLLCSPLIHGVFRIKLKCPYNLSKSQQIGPLLGVYDCQISTDGDTEAVGRPFAGSGDEQPLKGQYGYRPLLSFSSGNAVILRCRMGSGNW